jgi:hypothetical protein
VKTQGEKGDDGDAFFQSVVVGETEVTFTLADGTTTFKLPLMDTFKKVRDRVMPEVVATALASNYASTLSFIGEEVAVTRGLAVSAGITINGVTNEGNGRLALTVTPSGMTAGKGYAFALVMNDGTSMYSTAYTSVFYAVPPVAIGIAADGILAGNGNVSVGTTVQLIALLVPTDTNMKNVQWTTSDANVVTVDANAVVATCQRRSNVRNGSIASGICQSLLRGEGRARTIVAPAAQDARLVVSHSAQQHIRQHAAQHTAPHIARIGCTGDTGVSETSGEAARHQE